MTAGCSCRMRNALWRDKARCLRESTHLGECTIEFMVDYNYRLIYKNDEYGFFLLIL